MRTGSFLPTSVGAVGVVVLIVNLLTEGHEAVAQLALGLILFSITLAVVAQKADPA
ncbi:MAG: hypothetical protein Q4P15_04925 [Propionibacteriaceae bacterium]|nr:hypothetical protein [Propionibacteriaceae bacterium]